MSDSRTDSACRLIEAAPERIYRAFIDPEALIAWLPPEGMRGRVLLFEPRQGGCYRIELTLEGEGGGSGKTTARTDVASGRFLELVPNERIVQTAEFDSADPAFAGTMVMTWSLDPVAEGARVTVSAAGVPPGISADDHSAGLKSSLDNLARFLAAQRDSGAPSAAGGNGSSSTAPGTT